MSRGLKLTLFLLLFLFTAIFLGGSIGFGDDLASTDATPLSTTAGANTTYTITFDNSDQADPPPANTPIPANGFISHESPLGKAFIGCKKGEKVTVTTPGGDIIYKILEVA